MTAMTQRLCAVCHEVFETDVVNETLCATCSQRQWWQEQRDREDVLAERRRLAQERCDTTNDVDGQTRTACQTCGYVYFSGSHGARMCPECVSRDSRALLDALLSRPTNEIAPKTPN